MKTRYLVVSAASLIAALSFTVAACDRQPAGKTHVFKCSDGVMVTVTFSEKDDAATLRMSGKSYKLKHVSAASGAKYSDGEVVFWSKGTSAVIQIGGEVVHDGCKLVE